MLYNKLSLIFNNMRNRHTLHSAKQELSSKILRYFWPNRNIIWINSVSVYDNIERVMAAFPKKRDIIILQTEEDFLKFYDIKLLRNKIKNSAYWTENSFLITNCELDYKISKSIIQTVFKPGILDLICYLPYNIENYNFSIDNIKYYTGFHYRRQDLARSKIVEILSKYKNKVSTISYNKNLLVANITNSAEIIINENEPIDPPFLDVNRDHIWSDNTAFHIVVEPINNFSIDRRLHRYTPILSEKTYRAMHLLRPALVYSGTGTKLMLENLGFDTWDWLIDWSFDQEEDPVTGFKMYLTELDRLLNLELTTITTLLHQNQDKLLHNRKTLIDLINNYDSKP